MRSLRLQVDRIDRKILQLLQKRTKLSARIGETKRRHRSVIYVPEREHELLARVDQLSRGQLPPGAASAIYREILSGSRATQRQGPIGLIEADADLLTGPARNCFGACDSFSLQKNWPALARGLKQGTLAAALLSGVDLAGVFRSLRARSEFLSHFMVGGDFSSLVGWRVPPLQRVFIILPQTTPPVQKVDRGVVLIKCKLTENSVKIGFRTMSRHPLCAGLRATPLAPAKAGSSILYLTFPEAVDANRFAESLLEARNPAISLLGAYLSSEGYGG